MTREELILALCRAAGATDTDEMVIVDWECGHQDCCDGEPINKAACGDVLSLIRVRQCAGLSLFL